MAMTPAQAHEEQAAWRRGLKTFTGPLGNPLTYGNYQFELCADGRQVAVFNCLEDARRVRDAINALLSPTEERG